jgi:hypothetical protein
MFKRFLKKYRKPEAPASSVIAELEAEATRVEEEVITTASAGKLFGAAYNRGFLAGKMGKGIQSCPYEDRRNYMGGSPFNRGNIQNWRAGWRVGHIEFLKLRNRSVDTEEYTDV